jgi:Ca-activated chloride channel family protein
MRQRVRWMRAVATALVVLAVTLLACRGGKQEGGASGDSGPAADRGRVLDLLFTYGSEKEEWIREVTDRFNAAGLRTSEGKRIVVEAVPQGSGEAVDDLLSGARRAHLTSPASEAFIKLGNAQSRVKTGRDLVGETRSLVVSPVVIALWRPMAEALGWGRQPIGWSDILALARDPQGWAEHGHPEWGAFRFGHTHPEYSNSGLISLLAEVYAATGKTTGLSLEDVRLPSTAEYLAGIESSVVHYGSSTGFFGKRMFEGGPSYLSAAVLYENMVIESTRQKLQFPVVAIYPKEGTFWSDHPVGIVQRDWVTAEHRAAAQVYIDYLLARPQQEKALQYGFRPADVEIPLGAPFDAAHGVDPKEPQTTLEVPPVEVIDAVLGLWRQNKKRSDVALVLDTSGSMREEDRLEHARGGAEQLVALLGDGDVFSLLTFNSEPRWAFQQVRLGAAARQQAVATLRGLFPAGGTALYDSTALAYEVAAQAARRDPGRIHAIVVLTDGEDTDSSLTLPALLDRIRAGEEGGGLRVFTIGYGGSSQKEVLEQIADASRAKFYEGAPQNIRAVFREIATFF